MTDLLTLTSFSNKTSSGEADLLTGLDLDRGLALFTELTPGAILLEVRVTMELFTGFVLGVQAWLVGTADLRVAGRDGFFTGELLAAGPLLGILVLEMRVLEGTFGRINLFCRVFFGSSLVTGVILTLLGNLL